MRNIKRVLATLIALSLLAICIPKTVQASNDPLGTISNPAKLGTSGKFKTSFIKSNNENDQNAYASFKLKKQGFVTITVSKPRDSYGNIIPLEIYIYDSQGNSKWECSTRGQQNLPTMNYTYRVGLKKGSYTLRLYAARYNLSEEQSSCNVKIKTTANSYWEIENNDSFDRATTLKLSKKYTGVFCDTRRSAEDIFRIKLTNNKKYTIRIGNSGNLFSQNTTLCGIYDPNQSEVTEYKQRYTRASSTLSRNGAVVIKPNRTGYYYIKLYNSSGLNHPGIQYTLTVKPK